jgi:hypothetical protein
VGLKDQLLRLIAEVEQAEKELIASLSPEDRDLPGQAEDWSPKDVLLHIAAWNRDLVNRLEGSSSVGEPESLTGTDDANRRLYEAHAGIPWEDVQPMLEAEHARLASFVRGIEEQELSSTERFPWQRDQPLWRSLTGTFFVHPVMHVTQAHLDLGHREAARRLQDRAVEQLSELDDSPSWLGVVRYNLACFYALAGEREMSLATLRAALELQPGLREWSRKDPDLVSLRGDREFERLAEISGKPGSA